MGISQALNIHDLRKLARRRLPRMVYDYLEGGSEDQVTLKANREVLSTHSSVPLARLAREAGGPPWYQLYMPRERDAAKRLVQRALDAGCEALVLTTDVPLGGNREYNDRNGFGIPLRLPLRAVMDGLLHPRWLLGVFARAWLSPDKPMQQPEWTTRRDQMSWQDLAWLREAWPRKLLVKGVL